MRAANFIKQITKTNPSITHIQNDVDADHRCDLQDHDDWLFATNDEPTPQEMRRLTDEAEYKKARWALMKNNISPTERRITTLRRHWERERHKIVMRALQKHKNTN